MYAKVIIYDEKDRFHNENGVSDKDGNQVPKVVPYTVQIFEGKRITYRKIAVKNAVEFNNISSGLSSYTLLTYIPVDMQLQEEEIPFEFILLLVYSDDNPLLEIPDSFVIAADSVVYIMNESGKTIDKVACRNDH